MHSGVGVDQIRRHFEYKYDFGRPRVKTEQVSVELERFESASGWSGRHYFTGTAGAVLVSGGVLNNEFTRVAREFKGYAEIVGDVARIVEIDIR